MTAIRPVAIKIDEEIRACVKRLADARHRTAHWLMREAITQYVEREEKREAFRQDTLREKLGQAMVFVWAKSLHGGPVFFAQQAALQNTSRATGFL